MMIGRVAGPVVMTVKHPSFEREKLLAVDVLDEHGAPTGQSVLALDRAQAGVGDHVLVMREGSGVRQILGRDQNIPTEDAVKMNVPVRSLIVGIIDRVDVEGAS